MVNVCSRSKNRQTEMRSLMNRKKGHARIREAEGNVFCSCLTWLEIFFNKAQS